MDPSAASILLEGSYWVASCDWRVLGVVDIGKVYSIQAVRAHHSRLLCNETYFAKYSFNKVDEESTYRGVGLKIEDVGG